MARETEQVLVGSAVGVEFTPAPTIATTRPHKTELRAAPEKREHLEDVLACFDYLIEQADTAPEDRDPANTVLAIVDPIADIFQDNNKVKENREGGREIVKGNTSPEIIGGGGLNLVSGLAPFAREVHVITRVGNTGMFAGVTRQLLEGLPPHVKLEGVITQEGANDSVKLRWRHGPTPQDTTAYREDAPALDDATTSALQSALVTITESNPSIRKVGISEYGRNAINPPIIDTLNAQIEQGILQPSVVIYDPRADNRQQYDMFDVRGAILAPNREETAKLSGVDFPTSLTGSDLDDATQQAAKNVFGRFTRVGGLLATFDHDGAFLVRPDGSSIHMPATIQQSEFVNSSGGGDTVDATFILLPDRIPLEARVHAAMYTGGLAVSKDGTTTLSPALVREARARVAADLAFKKGYSHSTKLHNKGFLPEVAAPVMAEALGRPDLADDILAIMQAPDVQLYPDTRQFTEQVVATGDHFTYYTQGQGEGVIDADTPLSADRGYQMRKVEASGMPEILGADWQASAKKRNLPKVVGGLDKRASLEQVGDRLRGASQVVIVDDKLDNVTAGTDTLHDQGIPAFGVLVDRKGVYRKEQETLPDHIIRVKALADIPVDVVSSQDGNTVWMVDWDETEADHEFTKADLRRRLWQLSMQNRKEDRHEDTRS